MATRTLLSRCTAASRSFVSQRFRSFAKQAKQPVKLTSLHACPQAHAAELSDLASMAILEGISDKWMTSKKLFTRCDHNDSGSIDVFELQDMLDGMDIQVDVLTIFKEIDADGDSTINQAEWDSFMAPAIAKSDNLEKISYPIEYDLFEPNYIEGKSGGLVGLVAHNEMKPAMAEFVKLHLEFFKQVRIVTTGSTGKTLEQKMGLKVAQKVASGPLGGDQQIGGFVTKGEVAGIFFFKDPLSAHQHAADIEALTRVCDVHQTPYATNASTGHALVLGLNNWGLDFKSPPDSGSSAMAKYKAKQDLVINEVSKK